MRPPAARADRSPPSAAAATAPPSGSAARSASSTSSASIGACAGPCHAAGIPAHAVAAGSVSPFITRESASSREPSSMNESYKTTDAAPTVQPFPIRRRDAFRTRSSNRCVCTMQSSSSAAPSPISTRSHSRNPVVSRNTRRPMRAPSRRRYAGRNGVPAKASRPIGTAKNSYIAFTNSSLQTRLLHSGRTNGLYRPIAIHFARATAKIATRHVTR